MEATPCYYNRMAGRHVSLRAAVIFSGFVSSLLVLVYLYMISGPRTVVSDASYKSLLQERSLSASHPHPLISNGTAEVDRYKPFESNMTGKVNYDVWHWIVGYTVDDMRIKRSFPNHPDDRNTTDSLHTAFSEKDPNDIRGRYAHKIYGYLLPEEKGEYTFKVEMSGLTAACTVELWISTDTDPMNMHKVAKLEYPEQGRSKYAVTRSTSSSSTFLDRDYHYFEFLEKAFDGQCIVDIKWEPPSSGSFSPIPSSDFAMAANFDAEGRLLDRSIAEVLQGPLPSNTLQDHHHVQFIGDTIYPITDLDVLPKCDFVAEYVHIKKFKLYEGYHSLFDSDVYPGDKTEQKITRFKVGNTVIKPKKVEEVLSMYKKAFEASDKYDGEVLQVRSLERTKNLGKGFRFLLELDIKFKNKTLHTSEYVYLPNDGSGLCHTVNFQWKKNVDVHFLVTLKNLAQWAVHLFDNMEYVYSQTQDDHFSLVVIDVESEDIDIEEVFRKRQRSFKRWHVIKLTGGFVKPVAYQAGLDYIQDPNSIVMTFDMHLTITPGFVEYTRKHVVQNKMAFVPMVFRLQPGYTEVNLKGFWEIGGTGLFAMYKSDYEVFDGYRHMDDYKEWGGEDWKLLDRAMEKGYEPYRVRCPGLVHYHHTKASAWNAYRYENFPVKKNYHDVL